ncbi:MAG TPA: NAD(P)-binding domain-containing protein, partial [Candidatus Sulfotelmatobacter sp.]|nr:NAD(P)-binding domain-containing protein [Candidatus Sulfotelmatobacter sp.]
MARNLVKAGHALKVFDVVPASMAALVKAGATAAANLGETASGVDMVITMLPAGPEVRAVYLDQGGVLARASADALLIDCSTIDVETARLVTEEAKKAGFEMLDAPVSGGVMGAQGGTLTFMVGGTTEAFAKGRPVLANMGRTIVHAGPAGSGQIAKICNNMMLAVSMIGVCEGFALAEKLGLPTQ